jgi:hypothetical protein
MSIEEELQSASEYLDIPGAVVFAIDAAGNSNSLPRSPTHAQKHHRSFHHVKGHGVSNPKKSVVSSP